jgi:hypothetical protein
LEPFWVVREEVEPMKISQTFVAWLRVIQSHWNYKHVARRERLEKV